MSTSLKKYFPAGTPVKWSASAENFITESGELILNDDTTLTIKLKSSRILFSWDGGGTKTVWFGGKEMTSTSPIYLGNDGLITDIDNVFSNDFTTKNVFLDAEGFPNKGSVLYDIFNDDTNTIENIEIVNSSHIADFRFVFANMQHIKTVSVDTSSATMMESMFSKSAIVNAPILETSNVISTKFMFFNCSNLEYIPLYDFSNVQNMYGTFSGCTNLTTIPQINTSHVTNMDSCFSECIKLKSVPLLDFSNVTTSSLAFYQCTSLTDVGGFIGLKADIDFKYSPLTHDSALNIIDNLAVSSGHKVIFKRSTFRTLTSAEIARATDKGWEILEYLG